MMHRGIKSARTGSVDNLKRPFSPGESDSGGMLFAFLTFNPANKEQKGMGSVDLLPS